MVAGCGQDVERALADPHDGHVEGSAAQVVDEHGAVPVRADAERERRRCRLVDNPAYVESSYLPGVHRCLAPRVVEEGWHGDDHAVDLLAEDGFRVLLQPAQDKRGDLLGAVACALRCGEPPVAVTYMTFGELHDVVRRYGRGAFGHRPDQGLISLEIDNRRSDPFPLPVRQDSRCP